METIAHPDYFCKLAEYPRLPVNQLDNIITFDLAKYFPFQNKLRFSWRVVAKIPNNKMLILIIGAKKKGALDADRMISAAAPRLALKKDYILYLRTGRGMIAAAVKNCCLCFAARVSDTGGLEKISVYVRSFTEFNPEISEIEKLNFALPLFFSRFSRVKIFQLALFSLFIFFASAAVLLRNMTGKYQQLLNSRETVLKDMKKDMAIETCPADISGFVIETARQHEKTGMFITALSNISPDIRLIRISFARGIKADFSSLHENSPFLLRDKINELVPVKMDTITRNNHEYIFSIYTYE